MCIRDSPGAAVAEILEGDGLEADAVGHALVGEGLHQALDGPQLVEGAVEGGVRGGDLRTVAPRRVAIAAAGARVPHVNLHGDVLRTQPPDNQLRVDPGPVHPVGRCVEVADDADRRQFGVSLDPGLARRGHDAAPCSWLVVSWSSSMAVSTVSRRRNRSSACRRYLSIHLVIRSNTSVSRWHGRRWASLLRLTNPASSSTLRCLETAWTETP